MVDFSKFDSMVNQKELEKQMNAAPEYDDVPKGTYMVNIDKMELKPTKANDGVNFSVQMAIISTIDAPKNQDKRKIFFNRKICGNKVSDKWNDGVAIKGVIAWVKKMLDEDDTLEFKSYSDFADEILDIYQDICPQISLKVNYDPDAFNSVAIVEVFDR